MTELAYGGEATYDQRQTLYDMVLAGMITNGLAERDLVVDVGAGNCDFDMTLRRHGWFVRYLPIDVEIDGTDVAQPFWSPPEADWFVLIDVVEHLRPWKRVVRKCQRAARKGVLVSTADAESVDVLGMHESHVSAVSGDALGRLGFGVARSLIGGGVYLQLNGLWLP